MAVETGEEKTTEVSNWRQRASAVVRARELPRLLVMMRASTGLDMVVSRHCVLRCMDLVARRPWIRLDAIGSDWIMRKITGCVKGRKQAKIPDQREQIFATGWHVRHDRMCALRS